MKLISNKSDLLLTPCLSFIVTMLSRSSTSYIQRQFIRLKDTNLVKIYAIKKFYFILVAACQLTPPSTSPTDPFRPGREGSSSKDANTAPWHKVESKNTKRLRKQQALWDKQTKEVKSDSNQPQQIKVKLFSGALSTLNTFAEA